MTDRLTITTDGYEYAGWTAVTVTRSIEQAASSFSLSMAGSSVRPGDIRPGAPCEVRIGRSLVLTGYTDAVTRTKGATTHGVEIDGRSRTSDLVDCSIITDPPQFRGRTLPDIATVLAAPYGVEVVDEVGLDEPIRKFVCEVGETPFAAIERLARERSVLVTDDPWGRLVLTRGGTLEVPPVGRCLSSSLRVDASERYSEYRIKAQSVGTDEAFGASVAGIEALVVDPDLRRPRVLVLRGERSLSAAEARRRAVWEAVTRAGRSAEVTLTVRGWRASDGLLWAPNALTRVTDATLGVDADLLIVSVTYSAGAQGLRTTMTLRPPGAYEPLPPKDRKKRGKKKITAGVGGWDELKGGV